VMKARQLISGAAFGPEVLKVIGKAFDDAWAEVAPSVGGNPLAIWAARLRLANIILRLTTENTNDAERLKAVALEAYRRPRT
jgi:phage baseplate assembly protein W